MVISVVIIVLMIVVTIKTNFGTKNAKNDFDEYPSGSNRRSSKRSS